MIQRVKIQEFRALRKVEAAVKPLTVLIGPNDSGKSSFLDAIELRSRSRDWSFTRSDWWRESRPASVWLLDEGDAQFDGRVALFKLPSEGIPMHSKGVADDPQVGAPPLETAGSNLAAFLDYLLRKDRRRFDQIQQTLQRLVPGLEEISITTPSAEARALSLTIEGGFHIPGDRLSTGARMIFFFVALALHPRPPDVVLIEEPENGVHPKRLKDIVALLRGMSEGSVSGQGVQVVLTTHSPYLLDQVRLPQDQVLVFRREPDGRRTAEEADKKRLKTFLDEFMLGEVWFNHGEEGLLASKT